MMCVKLKHISSATNCCRSSWRTMKRVCNCYQTVSTTALLICKVFPLINCKRSEGCCRLEKGKLSLITEVNFSYFFSLHFSSSSQQWLAGSVVCLWNVITILRCLHFLNCHKNLSNKNKSWAFFVRNVKSEKFVAVHGVACVCMSQTHKKLWRKGNEKKNFNSGNWVGHKQCY